MFGARNRLAVVLLSVLAVGVFAAGASAKTIGIVPPANPRTNCDTSATASLSWTAKSIDRCRAREGVGPLALPRNWSRLTRAEQMLVLINLERVNRGLAPVAGLSKSLDALAAKGADGDSDPPFPAGDHFAAAGGVWAGVGTVFEADYGWMYDDGWGVLHFNLDCTSAKAPGCWGHRDVILMHGVPTLVGGGAYAHGNAYNSYAFELVAGYSARGMAFTWKSELKYFAKRPRIEPLRASA